MCLKIEDKKKKKIQRTSEQKNEKIETNYTFFHFIYK